jgi:CO dehydrogenase maturation factor
MFVDQLMDSYSHVIIDNEAGMEHLSRRTAREMDLLILVSDPTAVGVSTAVRLSQLADELDLKVKRKVLLINGVRSGKENKAEQLAIATGLEVFLLHDDEAVRDASSSGTPIKGDEPLASELRELVPNLFPSNRRR